MTLHTSSWIAHNNICGRRKAPLKDLTPQRIRIKLIEREIHEIQYHKNQVLQSLPIEKQKALVAETKAKIHALVEEKAKLLDDIRPATYARSHPSCISGRY